MVSLLFQRQRDPLPVPLSLTPVFWGPSSPGALLWLLGAWDSIPVQFLGLEYFFFKLEPS